MATKITGPIFEDAEKWLLENMPGLLVDSVCSIYRANYDEKSGLCRYRDTEANDKEVVCTLRDHVKGLKLLCRQIGKTLFVGGIHSPTDLVDPGNWDAEVVDAFRQLCFYGEVIYG